MVKHSWKSYNFCENKPLHAQKLRNLTNVNTDRMHFIGVFLFPFWCCNFRKQQMFLSDPCMTVMNCQQSGSRLNFGNSLIHQSRHPTVTITFTTMHWFNSLYLYGWQLRMFSPPHTQRHGRMWLNDYGQNTIRDAKKPTCWYGKTATLVFLLGNNVLRHQMLSSYWNTSKMSRLSRKKRIALAVKK